MTSNQLLIISAAAMFAILLAIIAILVGMSLDMIGDLRLFPANNLGGVQTLI